jgi:hypothetical protein
VESLKSLGQGFLVALGLVWTINIVSLLRGGDIWLGFAYLLILVMPAISIVYLKFKTLSTKTTRAVKGQWKGFLFAFQGVALAFWSYDLSTTFYVINITGLGVEKNPLGWPFGLLGALAFYGPVLIFSYALLFRFKEKISFYAAIPLTTLTIAMGMMNLFAGAQNFQVFVHTATMATNLRFGFFTAITAVDLIVPTLLTRKLQVITSTIP